MGSRTCWRLCVPGCDLATFWHVKQSGCGEKNTCKTRGCGNDFLCEREPIWRIRNRRNVVSKTSGMVTVLRLHHWDTRCFLLSPSALINPAELYESADETESRWVNIFVLLPASWQRWRSPSLSSPRCLVHQRLMSPQREMVPSGCQWEEWVWQKTAGSPLVSIRK